MSIKLAFANDEFYQKKKTEITDNQHDRQPRKMIKDLLVKFSARNCDFMKHHKLSQSTD